MKIKALMILAISLIFFSSCTKEEADPVLEIYVTTLPSENWQIADMSVSTVRFSMELEDGDAFGNLQNFRGVEYQSDLKERTSKLIFNDKHFDMEKLFGLNLDISNLFLSNGDEGVTWVDYPYYRYTPLDEVTAIENEKSYRIEFILDLDELVYEEDGKLFLDNGYDIEITEL